MHSPGPPNFMFRPVRTHLLEELQRLQVWPKVLHMVAPIGYGKTVLMSELHAHLLAKHHACRWVDLEERHSGIDSVLQAVLEALAGRSAGLEPTQALLRGDESLERRVDAVLDELGHQTAPLTVFVDNLNNCTDDALGPLLDALMFRTAESVRFVWSSTEDLGMNVGRAKLEGQIRYVGFQDLSFDVHATRELLGADLGEAIGQAGVDAVQTRTEGWPAAVRLAQIVLSNAKQPLAALNEFSGSDEDVAALLNRQVLGHFTPQLREFLMCLSQFRTFDAALCRHAIKGAAVEEHLDYLLRRNVFVVPLDRNRKRYRLHSLFREYLLGQAAVQLSTKRRHEVLLRASQWNEQAGEWHDAISCALAAGAIETASRLLEHCAHEFVRESGDIRQFVAWVEVLQAAGAQIGWDTHYWYVWALVFQRRYEHGLQQHQSLAERCAARASGTRQSDELAQRMSHLRICIDFFADRIAEATHGAETWLAENTSKSPYGISSIGCIRSLCLASSHRLPEAWKTMRAAQPVLLEIDGADIVGWISVIHAVLLAYEGDYGRAHDELTSGLAEARRRLGEDAVLCGIMACVGAHCAVEMGRQDEARELLTIGLRVASNNVMLDFVACGFDAAVKLWGGSDDAIVSIARLRTIAKGYPPRLSLMLSCHLIRRLLRLGRKREALDEAARIALVPDREDATVAFDVQTSVARCRDLHCAATIDVLMATGRYKRAQSLVAREYRLAKEEGRAGRLVELGLATAEIELQAGNAAAAGRALAGAFSRAAKRRLTRPFHDHAQTLHALVNAGKISSWSFALADERAFFEAICRSVPDEELADATATELVASNAPSPPTAREAELLRLLEKGLSNQQIADHTQISITTIKWHLRNLYRKLGVSTRIAALARARAMSALPSPTPSTGISRPPKGGAGNPDHRA